MIITSKIMRQWTKVIEDVGITKAAEQSGVDLRTLNKALKEGKIKDDLFVKVQKFMSDRKKTVQKLIEQDQD